MPGFDGTGPAGMGPMTGGGRGYCNPGAGGNWGYGRGFGRGMGMGRGFGRGFGFRGSSPPWPYVGIGRGGLPRHAYYYGAGWGAPYEAPPAAWGAPFAPQMTKEDELGYLKDEAEAIKERLREIDGRIRDIETDAGS